MIGRAFVKTGFGGIGAAIVVAGGATGVRAQDARALLEKTIQTYQKMGSYQGKGIVEVNQAAGALKRTLQATSSEMSYRRPNKLTLTLSSRNTTAHIYSDGGRLTVYKEAGQQYSYGPVAPTLLAMLPLLRSRADVSCLLDPMYFLSHNAPPAGLTGLRLQPPTKVNGHDVVVITGLWTGAAPAEMPDNPFCSRGARWTLYLDKSSALLQKVEVSIATKMRVPIQRNGKTEATLVPAEVTMSHTIINAQPNAPIDDKAFAFTPPKGANEQKSVEDLIKSGK